MKLETTLQKNLGRSLKLILQQPSQKFAAAFEEVGLLKRTNLWPVNLGIASMLSIEKLLEIELKEKFQLRSIHIEDINILYF